MMAGITVAQLASAAGVSGEASNAQVSALGIDSRAMQPGGVFVAIKGAMVDGHAYVANAATNGAIAAVVERRQTETIEQIVVDDTQQALAKMARLNRDYFHGKVVAITGSAGKTTCKNMVTAIASLSSNVCATRGNLNNELGVPLTVQRLNNDHQVAVLELGAAKLGDIRYLTDIVQPDIAVITNVSEAHLGGFGTLENTARGKGEIYASLADGGIAVVNLDDPYAAQWLDDIDQAEAAITAITFSAKNEQANIVLHDLIVGSQGSQFSVAVNWQMQQYTLEIILPLLGAHNAMNALAATAVAVALQISAADIVAGFSELKPEPGRLCLVNAANDILLIDDSYNANPQSMQAAVDVLADYAMSGKKTVCVVGEMAELGSDANNKHYKIGEYIGRRGIDSLLAIGDKALQYQQGYEAAATGGSAAIAKNIDAVTTVLLSGQYTGAIVLIKGSRVAALDKLVAALKSRIEGVEC
jgi:UDP-N-acetylmuramoyl-tripeptide--D-alanyl-D-alanine ligase